MIVRPCIKLNTRLFFFLFSFVSLIALQLTWRFLLVSSGSLAGKRSLHQAHPLKSVRSSCLSNSRLGCTAQQFHLAAPQRQWSGGFQSVCSGLGHLVGEQSTVKTDTSAAEPPCRWRQEGLQVTNRRWIGLDFLHAALKDRLIRTYYLTTCRSSQPSIRFPQGLAAQKHDLYKYLVLKQVHRVPA